MRFAEVFLRLGSALVSWMVIYAYTLLLAIQFRLGCGPDGAEMHGLLLALAPLALLGAWLARVTRSLGDVHNLLVWLIWPAALLLPFAARSTWEVFATVNLNAAPICPDASPAGWEPYWAPVQIVTLILLVVLFAGLWRSRVSD